MKIKDKYNREVKLGSQIKDEKLRNEFASDKTRDGSKKNIQSFTTSTHRGVEVAGQTNKGHSWANHSCKNIEDGSNKKYLGHEITHGTVVHFVHDHTGKEIYRSTLQPHHNKENTTYHLDSEYGIKHPSFTKSSHDVANKLSGEYKEGLFTKHSKVYNDSGKTMILHPKATSEHISKALNDTDPDVRKAAIYHPKATTEHISKALNDKDEHVRWKAIKHPKATSEHIPKALNDKDPDVRIGAIEHPNATSEHISKALNDEDYYVRSAAIRHPNATSEHISKALNDKHFYVRSAAKRAQKVKNE